jgi:hypothetical protein
MLFPAEHRSSYTSDKETYKMTEIFSHVYVVEMP